ncbi:hypothetical protein Tco_0411380 [Tanacetum coccineum]
MAALKFAETHNLVAFLEKPDESEGFEQIVDFLNAHTIKHALTVNPTIYTSCIEQFWATAKVKTVNEEKQLQALVDRKKVIITEASVRRDLHLEDAEGTECLPTATIFEELTRMGSLKMGDNVAEDDTNEESVPTHSNDPLLSGEDRLKLNELMELYTKLTERVLDLEKAKTAQAKEIASLKKKVKKLEKKKRSRTPVLKRLRKVGRSTRIESSKDEGLGDQEDTSKQGRIIDNIDVDEGVTLIDETQGRNDDDLMFDTCVLDEQEVKVEKTLIEFKAAKPKVRGVMIQEPSEFITTTPAASKPLHDKGKEKMIEPEKPLKKKDQIMYDQEVALNLQVQLQAELEEEERLARQKEKEANIALIESWDNT